MSDDSANFTEEDITEVVCDAFRDYAEGMPSNRYGREEKQIAYAIRDEVLSRLESFAAARDDEPAPERCRCSEMQGGKLCAFCLSAMDEEDR